jgi:Mn2+/Fe2+ NRAMP family transporter
MGKYANSKYTTVLMLTIGGIVTFLNILLFISFFR